MFILYFKHKIMKVNKSNISKTLNQVHHNGRSVKELEITSQKMFHEGGDSDDHVEDTKADLVKKNDEEAAVIE